MSHAFILSRYLFDIQLINILRFYGLVNLLFRTGLNVILSSILKMVDSQNFSGILIFLIVLLFSVSVHELMHALVAYRLGDDLAHSAGRISLNPLKHIDPFLSIALPGILLLLGMPPILAAKPVPINTSRIDGEELGLAAVGIAGPLTNLALAIVVTSLLKALNPQGFMYDLMELFITLNVSLFVFNMLPIPPLDGSRVLYTVAPIGMQRVMDKIESFGLLAIIFLLTFLSPVIFPVIDNARQFILNILL